MKQPHAQRGVALLTAVLIVAIVAGLSIYLAWDRTLAFRRTQDMVNQDRARELCLGAEAWVAQTLASTADQPVVDLQQSWARPMPVTHIGSGEVGGRVEDLQGRFNLNNLIAGGQAVGTSGQRLRRLLEQQKAEPALEGAVLDWIDGDTMPRSSGAEDGVYMGRRPPYRAANRAFASASTLRIVRGFDAATSAALAPSITALPAGTPINVNTATPTVLRALGLDAHQVSALLRRRAKRPFDSVPDFLSRLPPSAHPVDPSRLGVGSHYFLMRAEAHVGLVRQTLYSVIHVENAGRVRVLMHAWNARP